MSQTRLLIINFTGDVRDAYHRLANGGPETYYAQRYSLEAQASLQEYVDQVCVLACVGKEAYDEVLPNGVRALNGGLPHLNDPAPIFRLIEKIEPTHVALCTPELPLIRWLATKPYRSIGCFAGSIPNMNSGLLRQAITLFRRAKLARCLNGPKFEWVGSYGLASCNLLVDAGVKPHKIIPWDLLLDAEPGSFEPKVLTQEARDFSVCFVGAIQEGKGVGDLIDAVALLRKDGFPIRATIVGNDADGFARTRIEHHGLQDHVTLPGLIPNHEVEPFMRQNDVVVVPSRPEYPEGFPLVIHHGLRSRTPLVASNHPVFLLHLKDEVGALLFPAGDAPAMATAFRRVLTEPALYAQLSLSAHDTWRQMRLPVKWRDIIEHWIKGTAEDGRWLEQNTLAKRNG